MAKNSLDLAPPKRHTESVAQTGTSNMAVKKKTKDPESPLSPVDQIKAYLSDDAHKDDHYNFEEDHDYIVSSGSLTLDLEMSGGIRPSIIRASGVAEGGKTSCALAFARNFQRTVKNSMAVYIKAEGRLSAEMIAKSGVDTSVDKWFIFKSNIFECVLEFLKELIKNNPHGYKYFFIIDSMDALIPKKDLEERTFYQADKVAGGSVLSSTFLKKMALALSTRGHICFMISQVRSVINAVSGGKAPPKRDYQLTNASGGNALLHYSDWILEFQPRYNNDLIPPKKSNKIEKESKIPYKQEGHYCKVIFRKSPNEKTGIMVKYPIKYGRTGGTSVWIEYEIANLLLEFDHLKKAASWYTVNEESVLIKSLSEIGLEMEKKFQGVEKIRKYLEDNPKICTFFFNKFKEALPGFTITDHEAL